MPPTPHTPCCPPRTRHAAHPAHATLGPHRCARSHPARHAVDAGREKFDKALKDANECVRLQPTWAKGYSRQAAAFLSL
eukprot:3265468-Prymnesium_polylepis.1